MNTFSRFLATFMWNSINTSVLCLQEMLQVQKIWLSDQVCAMAITYVTLHGQILHKQFSSTTCKLLHGNSWIKVLLLVWEHSSCDNFHWSQVKPILNSSGYKRVTAAGHIQCSLYTLWTSLSSSKVTFESEGSYFCPGIDCYSSPWCS